MCMRLKRASDLAKNARKTRLIHDMRERGFNKKAGLQRAS